MKVAVRMTSDHTLRPGHDRGSIHDQSFKSDCIVQLATEHHCMRRAATVAGDSDSDPQPSNMKLPDWIQIVFLSPLVPVFVDRLHECRMPPQ